MPSPLLLYLYFCAATWAVFLAITAFWMIRISIRHRWEIQLLELLIRFPEDYHITFKGRQHPYCPKCGLLLANHTSICGRCHPARQRMKHELQQLRRPNA